MKRNETCETSIDISTSINARLQTESLVFIYRNSSEMRRTSLETYENYAKKVQNNFPALSCFAHILVGMSDPLCSSFAIVKTRLYVIYKRDRSSIYEGSSFHTFLSRGGREKVQINFLAFFKSIQNSQTLQGNISWVSRHSTDEVSKFYLF